MASAAEQPIHFTVSSCSSCANETGLLALGSALPEHEVLDGWKSGPKELFPQELVLDLDPGTLELTSLHILSHESLIPSQIDVIVDGKFLVSLPFCSVAAKGGVNVREQKIVKLRRLDVAGMERAAGIGRVRLVVRGVHEDPSSNPLSQVQLIQVTLTGLTKHHHAHHHHTHNTKRGARADTQLHQMGLASLAEAQIHERGVGGNTDGANEVLASLDDDVDVSTGMLLDMLRRQKNELVHRHGKTNSEAKKAEAQRHETPSRVGAIREQPCIPTLRPWQGRSRFSARW